VAPTSIARLIQETKALLAKLENDLAAASFDPGEVIRVCEAKVRRLRRDIVRYKQWASELPTMR